MNQKKAAVGFIFITILLDVTGLGIIIPVLPKLITELIGGNLSQAATYGGWLMFAYAFMQFLFAPVLGGLSDQFGRRSVLLFALFGFFLDYLLMAFAPTITWLFIGRLLAGITGASITTATAYIADISTSENRAQNFGMVGAAFGLGFIVGPVLGGLLGQYGARIPFFAAAGLTFLNWLYGYFVLPESLSKENRRKFEWKRASPVGSLKGLNRNAIVIGLAISTIFSYLAMHATHSTWAYYTMEKFQWDEKMVGYSLGFVGIMVAIIQGGLIRVIVPKVGQKKAVYIGLVTNIIGLFLFGLASQGWMMFGIVVIYAFGGLAGPTLQSIMTGQVSENAQGELQGALTSLSSLTAIVGPPMMTGVFAYFTKDINNYYPGAPFFLATILAIIALYFAARTLMSYREQA